MSKEQIKQLEAGKYVSFATLKRSGDYVATPVWFAPLDGYYYLFSAEDAGKVIRLVVAAHAARARRAASMPAVAWSRYLSQVKPYLHVEKDTSPVLC